jgi:hypothetical protein
MYVITLKKKPVTLEALYKIEGRNEPLWVGTIEYGGFLTGKTKKEAVGLFTYYFDLPWKKRAAGIDVRKAVIQ